MTGGGDRSRRRRRWASALLIAAVSAAGVMASADLDTPPRFDGAGYAMLARALLEGRGYREIDHPDEAPHAHFPPGYPALLAAVWSVSGRSLPAAHLLSAACTVGATVAAWCWFRRMYPGRVAMLLGLALAMNWTWHRIGGAIRSEPPYLLLQQLALLAVLGAARGGIGRGLRLGFVLGNLDLTRHVGVSVNAAVALELAIRRRWKALAASLAVAGLFVIPWAWWLITAPRPTQLGLLPGRSLPEVIVGNAWFYVLRMPDALSAPLIEVGTVFAPRAAPIASAGAVAASLVLAAGTVLTLRARRRRLAGLVLLCNLGLLLAWPFTEAGRFLVPLVPALLVAACEGIAAAAAGIGLRGRRARPMAALLLLLAATPYALYAAIGGRAEAERRAQGEVDAAFAWIARAGGRPGPIMTAYPAEAFWFTDRRGIAPAGDRERIEREIDRYGVAYLVAVESRFARAADDPLSRFVAERPNRVALRWSDADRAVRVFEVLPADEPAPEVTAPGPRP